MSELPSAADIEREARRLLRQANAYGRLPTPVDDLVAAAKLSEPEQSLLSPSVLQLAPAHLRDAVARLSGRVRGLLDGRAREIHLAPELGTEGRRTFVRLHETGHHILPWQRELAYADDDQTLSPTVRELFELEASQCAASLLFQADRFTRDSADLAIGMGAVIDGSQRHGSSIRAALRRYAETHRAALAGVVLDVSPTTREPLRYRRHEVSMSAAYRTRFGDDHWPRVLSVERYGLVAIAAGAVASSGTVVEGDWTQVDLAGGPAGLRVEALCTGYDLLVLAWIPIRERTRQRVRLVQ